MRSLIDFIRILLHNILPKNRIGDKIYAFINFVFIHRRFPTNKMISITEKICSNFDFIRVDIFTDGTKCFVGEITNIHANASNKFIPLSGSGEKTASETIFN